MAKKQIEIEIDDETKVFTIKGLKVKKLKPAVGYLSKQVDSVRKLFDTTRGDEDFLRNAADFISENMDFIDDIILSCSNITESDLKEVEIVDYIHVLIELLAINGITKKAVSDFFSQINGITAITKPKQYKAEGDLPN